MERISLSVIGVGVIDEYKEDCHIKMSSKFIDVNRDEGLSERIAEYCELISEDVL